MSYARQPIEATNDHVDRRQFLGVCAAGAAAAALTPASSLGSPVAGAKPTHSAPLAFWSLSGQLKSADVNRQLDAYANVGWGAVLYPRWGAEVEYFTDEWFERIRYIVEQAAARSMEIWLYDEFCWPSGHAKGLVAKDHPELVAQVLYVNPDGTSRVDTMPPSANMLTRAATDRFLALTHERYAATIGQHFGKTVRAIFTDEPSVRSVYTPLAKSDKSWHLMWSETLNQALGGDFVKRLAAAGSKVAESPLWRDYWAAYARVFHDVWTKPIADWCQSHNLPMSGHLLGENSFGDRVANYGSLHMQLREFQFPGIDEIHTRWEVDKCETMTLATIAEYPGRERMCEVFALGPCFMTLDTMRKMVDLCSCCGVDRYVMAISPFDMRGNYFNRGWLNALSPQQPWFRDFARPFADYLAEAAQRARKAQPLGVRWPADEDLWAVAGPAPNRSQALKEMTKKFQDEAREAIRARVPRPPAASTAPRTKLEAAWSFEPAGLNSIRIDGPSLVIQDLPSTADLSIQVQLVRGLRINGKPIDLSSAPADTQFDLSYCRIPVAKLLRRGENKFEIKTDEPKPLPFLPALILWGNFAVDARRQIVAQPKTIALGDWRSQGYSEFCGVGRYRTTVQWSVAPLRLILETGDYPARVLVNGRECGRRPWGPFEFDLRGAARSGANEIVVEVASTVGHLFVAATAPAVGLFDTWVGS
jgi:hypothetical protein